MALDMDLRENYYACPDAGIECKYAYLGEGYFECNCPDEIITPPCLAGEDSHE